MCIHYVYVYVYIYAYVGHHWFPVQAFNGAFLVVGTCVWLKSMVGGCRACGFSPSFGPQGTQCPDQSPAYGSKHFFFGHSDVGEAIKLKCSVFLTEWNLVQWLMLWCQCVRTSVGSSTVKSNMTKEKPVVHIQTKPNLEEFLTSSHTISWGRKCYILRLETYCTQVCTDRFIEIFHVKVQFI